MTDYGELTVEELLDEMDSDVVEGYPRDEKKVDALIATIKEQNRVGIWSAQLTGFRVQASQFPDDERRNCRTEVDIMGIPYALVPLSAIAPRERK